MVSQHLIAHLVILLQQQMLIYKALHVFQVVLLVIFKFNKKYIILFFIFN